MAYTSSTYNQKKEGLCDPRRLSNKRKYGNDNTELNTISKKNKTIDKSFDVKTNKFDITDPYNIDYYSFNNTDDSFNKLGESFNSMGDSFNTMGDSFNNMDNSFTSISNPFISTSNPFINSNEFCSSSRNQINGINPFNTPMNQLPFSPNQFNGNMASVYKSIQVFQDIIEKQNRQIAFFESQQDKMTSMERRINELTDKNKLLQNKCKILKKDSDKLETTRSNFNKDYKHCKLKFRKILTTIHDIFNKYPSLYKISIDDNIIVSGKMDGYNYDKSGEYINGIHIVVPLNIYTTLFVNNQFLLDYNSNLCLNTSINNWDKVRVFCPRRISFKQNLKIGEPVKLQIFTNAITGKKDSTIGKLIFD
tara:strand:- start:1674 stop:2765 length:1092 start_codon:yes stop_codon:yes gene_type:complete